MIARLCSKLVDLLLSSFIYIISLRDSDEEVKLSAQFRAALQKLRVAAFQKANRFLDQFHEVTLHCKADSKMMRAAKTGINSEFNVVVKKIQTPDYAPLNDIIHHWTQNMSMARSCYKEFGDDCSDVISSCTQAIVMCRYKVKEATDKKLVVKVVGGAAVVASIVVCAVGAFISGFGLVAVASVAVAVGTAAASVYYVNEYEQSVEAFRSIENQLGSLLAASCDMKKEVGSAERELMRVSVWLDNLVQRRNNHESITSIQGALNDLSKNGSQLHQTIPSCRRCLESIVNKPH